MLIRLENVDWESMERIYVRFGCIVFHTATPLKIGTVVREGSPQPFLIVAVSTFEEYKSQLDFDGIELQEPPPGPFFYRCVTE